MANIFTKSFQSIMWRCKDFINKINQVSAALFFKLQGFLKPKLIEKFALSSENNLRERYEF